MTHNPWHDVSIGDKQPKIVSAIIENPKNNRAKYELDKESGMLLLDRVLFSSMRYPMNYGFIPQTYCDDKDPLDILILSEIDLEPMCLLNAKVIGVMQMTDGGEKDDKIIAVAADDVTVNHINELEELPPHLLKEVENFFEDYKKLEEKHVTVDGFEGKAKAIEIVKQSIEDYKVKFGA